MCVCVCVCVCLFVKNGLWESESEAFEVMAVIKGVLLYLLLIGEEDKVVLGVKMDGCY